MSSLRTPIADLTGLHGIFGDSVDEMPGGRFITADEMPEPYRTLLAHHDHMTVTLERFHGSLVDVHILKAMHDDPLYARKIKLTLSGTDKVVLFGIMRFNFAWCDERVKNLILEGKTPLGRVLIENDVLRRINTHVLLRITPNAEIRNCFSMPEPGNGAHAVEPVYGRLATIYCNDEPAVDLLEVTPPVAAAGTDR
jgi:chorismate-pyruvate lyase